MEDKTCVMRRKTLILIILICAIQIVGCAKKEKDAETDIAKKNTIDELMGIKQEVRSFRVEGFGKDRKLQWGLEGESANVVLDKININVLKAVYHGEEGTFTIFADKAVYDKKTQDIELDENIKGITSDGGELFTAHARWDAEKEEITTDSYVTVKRQNIACSGKGIVTKPRLKKMQFLKEVEVTIMPDKKITCDGPFELDHNESVGIFNKNVKITDKNSETSTDKLTIYLNPDTNAIERIVTEGNVEVVHKGDVEDIGKISF